MFQGAAMLSLDAKGRLGVPARHRDALAATCGGRLVLTAHPHKCLAIYPEPAWTPIRDQLTALPSLGDPRIAQVKRLLVGFAREELVDTAGRVLIAPELRDWAGLEKQVWLVGQGKGFELWSDERWRAQQDELLSQLSTAGMPPGLENLSL
ncbi:division/cell wall cluster transcriptional repressor MraZ [Uliginosibacterium sp. H1]|uniref:division/cell wall cluster transcriptional repressor MraZ n=1 Tax=Uliginosibacterium sp. H1 TaxID=3114757 RepID=UPI002E185FC6|nr:division/cell wall cluster transcriptional repressor MraZ [Uliginosibacterium sp. H1]